MKKVLRLCCFLFLWTEAYPENMQFFFSLFNSPNQCYFDQVFNSGIPTLPEATVLLPLTPDEHMNWWWHWWHDSVAATLAHTSYRVLCLLYRDQQINRRKLCWLRVSCSCNPFGYTAEAHAEPGSEFAELELFPYQVLNLEFSTSVCSREYLKLIYTVHVTKRIHFGSFFHPLLFDTTPLEHILGHCNQDQEKYPG